MSMDYKDLGKRIRSVRRKLSLTQEELAEKTGISASFIGHIERGTRVASLETLVLICNTLNVSPQYLLSASLNDELTEHMPTHLSAEERSRLGSFLRMAQETISNWGE